MIKILVSSVIDAPVEDVWQVVRAFNGLPDWHPLITRSEIEVGLPQDTVGCVRNFYLQTGDNVREQLTALSNQDHSFSYRMLETGMGMYHYTSTFSLQPITDGARTFLQWTAEFTTDPGQEQEKTTMVTNDVFQAGFDALKARFAARTQR